jgi:hypothetical protein
MVRKHRRLQKTLSSKQPIKYEVRQYVYEMLERVERSFNLGKCKDLKDTIYLAAENKMKNKQEFYQL